MKRRSFLTGIAAAIPGLLGLILHGGQFRAKSLNPRERFDAQRRDPNVLLARNLSNKTICHGETVYLNNQRTAILGYTDLSHPIIGVVDPYAFCYEITPGTLTFVQILDKSRSLSSQLISLRMKHGTS